MGDGGFGYNELKQVPTEEYKKFEQWVVAQYGRGVLMQIRVTNQEPFQYQEWVRMGRPSKQIGVPPAITAIPREPGQPLDQYSIDSLYDVIDDNGIVTKKGYTGRAQQFLLDLLYQGAITEEQAAEYANKIEGWSTAYETGSATFDQLPFLSILTRPDYPKYAKYYGEQVIAETRARRYAQEDYEAAQKAQIEQQIAQQDVNKYNKFKQDADAARLTGAMNESIAAGEQLNKKQAQMDAYNAQGAANVIAQAQVNQDDILSAQHQADIQNSWAAGIGAAPTVSAVYQETVRGLSPNMLQYFDPAAMSSKFAQEHPGERQAWWNALTTAPYDAGGSGASYTPESIAQLAEANNVTPAAMTATMNRYIGGNDPGEFFGTPQGAQLESKISWGEVPQPNRAEGLAADPFRQYLATYPFMSEWLQIAPQQRGARLAQTRARWVV